MNAAESVPIVFKSVGKEGEAQWVISGIMTTQNKWTTINDRADWFPVASFLQRVGL